MVLRISFRKNIQMYTCIFRIVDNLVIQDGSVLRFLGLKDCIIKALDKKQNYPSISWEILHYLCYIPLKEQNEANIVKLNI